MSHDMQYEYSDTKTLGLLYYCRTYTRQKQNKHG